MPHIAKIIRNRLAPHEAGAVLCVRQSVVVARILSTLEFAATLGYDLVGEGVRGGPTGDDWVIGGVVYPDGLVSADERTSHAMERQADQALDSLSAFRDLANPTNAQVIAVVKLICRVCILLIRWRQGRTDAAT